MLSNSRKEIRELKNQIQYLRTFLDKQAIQIKDLQEYEKQVVFEGYSATITRYHWDCGDGCCSDSWYGYDIRNKDGEIEYQSEQNTYMSEERIRETIKDKYGNIPVSLEDNYDDSSDRE